MRYFYYGPNEKKVVASGVENKSSGILEERADFGQDKTVSIDGDLVIEDDTIYEIDRNCMACRKRGMGYTNGENGGQY